MVPLDSTDARHRRVFSPRRVALWALGLVAACALWVTAVDAEDLRVAFFSSLLGGPNGEQLATAVLAAEGFERAMEAEPRFAIRYLRGGEWGEWETIDVEPVALVGGPVEKGVGSVGFLIDPRRGVLPIRLDVTEMAQVDAQVDLWLPTLLAADPSRWTDFPGPLRAQGLLPGSKRIFHGASATLSLVPAKHQIKTMEWSELQIREDGTGFEEPVVAELSCGWPSQTAVGAGRDFWQVPAERPR